MWSSLWGSKQVITLKTDKAVKFWHVQGFGAETEDGEGCGTERCPFPVITEKVWVVEQQEKEKESVAEEMKR